MTLCLSALISTTSKVLKSKDSTGNVWSETKKYVRESDGQLWVLDSTISINEVLIMDINLHKGDEFSYIDGLGRTMKLLVTKADTIIDMSGQQRKVLYLSCAENESFSISLDRRYWPRCRRILIYV